MKMRFICSWMRNNKLMVGQILSFICGKIILGLIQLPKQEKAQTYFVELTICALFFVGSFVCKLISIPKLIAREILLINLRSFLLWVVAILIIIFSFSLSHKLNWSSFEIVLMIVILLVQNASLILQCNWRYTSKIQFVLYQLILSVSIVALGIKTVIFIQFDQNSPNKDIVLLNLTTQIAFTILMMDSIQRAYHRYLQSRKSITSQMEQQLTNTV